MKIVVVTRNRRDQLLSTLNHHEAPVVVVDNGSSDGTAAAVVGAYPQAKVIALDENRGAAAARNLGVRRADSELVAFADDDSWWAPGALSRAAAIFRRFPRLGLLVGRVLVGPQARLDPVSALMASAPLGRPSGLPGPPVLGFLGCAAIVRRRAFLRVGGFTEKLHTYGEEDLLARDLASAGWEMAYVDSLIVRHFPDGNGRSPQAREVQERRNRLLTDWLTRPVPVAARTAVTALRQAPGRLALRAALRDVPWVWRHRRPVPGDVELALRRLATS